MKNKLLIILVLFCFCINTNCKAENTTISTTNEQYLLKTVKNNPENSDTFLKLADFYYKNQDEEKAKVYYQKAAELGNADAHFKLAYQYINSEEDAIYHYTEAAKEGHQEALECALEQLLFRANSLKYADPQTALGVYYQAKKINPTIKLYEEEDTVRTMKMCAEPKGFNAEEFMKKYGVEDEDDEFPFYDVWELAEEASIGGRFGKPNPELVLNLICRGSGVPFELRIAAEKVYYNWKNNINEEINICNFILSTNGTIYCESRKDAK